MTSSPLFRILVLLVLALGGWKLFEYQRQRGWEEYLVYFEDVEGLQPASPVKIKGVTVGKIRSLELVDPYRVKLSLLIREDQEIQAGALAFLANDGVNGEKRVDIIQGEDSAILAPGSVLGSRLDSNLLPLNHRISPMLETARFLLASSEAGLRGFHYALNSGLLQGAARTLLEMEDQLLDWEKSLESAPEQGKDWAQDLRASSARLHQLDQVLDEEPLQKMQNQTDSLVPASQALTRELKAQTAQWRQMVGEWQQNKPQRSPWLESRKAYDRLNSQIREIQGSIKTPWDKAQPKDTLSESLPR